MVRKETKKDQSEFTEARDTFDLRM